MVEYIEIEINFHDWSARYRYRYNIIRKSKKEYIMDKIYEVYNRETRIYDKEDESTIVISNNGIKKIINLEIKKIKKNEWTYFDMNLEVKNDENCIYDENYCYENDEENEDDKINEKNIKESIENVFEIYDEIKINENDIKKILIENTKNKITKKFPNEIVNMITKYI